MKTKEHFFRLFLKLVLFFVLVALSQQSAIAQTPSLTLNWAKSFGGGGMMGNGALALGPNDEYGLHGGAVHNIPLLGTSVAGTSFSTNGADIMLFNPLNGDHPSNFQFLLPPSGTTTSPSNPYASIGVIHIDTAVNAYYAGYFNTTHFNSNYTGAVVGNSSLLGIPGTTDIAFVTKLNPQGSFLWSFQTIPTTGEAFIMDMTTNYKDNLIILVRYTGMGTFGGVSYGNNVNITRNFFVAKIIDGPLGPFVSWLYDGGSQLVTCPFGDIEVVALAHHAIHDTDIIIGNHGCTSLPPLIYNFPNLATQPSYIGGRDVFLLYLDDPTGVPIYANALGSIGDDGAGDLAVAQDGSIYVTASVSGPTRIGDPSLGLGFTQFFPAVMGFVKNLIFAKYPLTTTIPPTTTNALLPTGKVYSFTTPWGVSLWSRLDITCNGHVVSAMNYLLGDLNLGSLGTFSSLGNVASIILEQDGNLNEISAFHFNLGPVNQLYNIKASKISHAITVLGSMTTWGSAGWPDVVVAQLADSDVDNMCP